MSKPMNAAEKRYVDACVRAGCVLCRFLRLGETAPLWHHQRTGQGKMRAKHTHGCALCPHHHQFSGVGVHDVGRLQFFALYGISEVGLINLTRREFAHLLPASERDQIELPDWIGDTDEEPEAAT
jgi:hypothetical protein